MTTVWLASYPKSGNTWVRALLHALRFGDVQLSGLSSSTERDHPPVGTGISLSELSEAEALALRRAYRQHVDRTFDDLILRKTHEAWLPAVDGFPTCMLPGARAVYIVRDPRDVAPSWAHHLGVSIDDAITVMRDEEEHMGDMDAAHPGYRPASWSTHCSSWLDQEEVPVLLVAYESLIENTAPELERIGRWLGLDVSAGRVAAAVETCAFDNLVVQEIVEGFVEASDPGRAFFRQGRAGGWRTALNARQVAQIEADHEQVMSRLGYTRFADSGQALHL